MSAMTNDDRLVVATPATRAGSGLLVALVSAASFGLSGPLASGLLATGWSPGALVLVRVGLAALVLTPLGLRSLRGRAGVVRRSLRLVVLYGVLAVAVCQFCYFSAVQRLDVGLALLIEYTSPLLILAWLWLRHGHRPGRLTLVGAALSVAGLLLVLDLVGGVSPDAVGVLWALAAMVGGASYFLINADASIGLPPLALAWLGLVVGAVVLALLGVAGLMPLHASGGAVALAGGRTPWWVPVVLLGVVTAALAYTTGVVAGRLLGARLASFVALVEVVAGVLFAWLLLDQLPHAVQLVGGLLVLAGVVTVKLGERDA
ncbi:DMT family transporter [Nocardioides sp. DS6]|uniref:DMT family transporter n=1 Tax=Nocardioides eburneus TaxID=3231482 RepID=A0ABV3T2V1_9ACTN